MIEHSHYNEIGDITTMIFMALSVVMRNERFSPKELVTLVISDMEEAKGSS